MSTLESEIIEKFHQLQPAAKQRVRALIEQETALEAELLDVSSFDYVAWFREVDRLRQQIRGSLGNTLPPIDVIGMLRDIRDDEDE